jgi:hypothetical protein
MFPLGFARPELFVRAIVMSAIVIFVGFVSRAFCEIQEIFRVPERRELPRIRLLI